MVRRETVSRLAQLAALNTPPTQTLWRQQQTHCGVARRTGCEDAVATPRVFPAATPGPSEPITEDLSVPPHTMKPASRDAVDKLRLDGAPTPRSWVARMTKRSAPTCAGKSAPVAGGPTGRHVVSEFTSDDQWRSLQTFVAAYLAGMVHPRDVFTISPRSAVTPPLVEFWCDAAGRLWFSVGARSWSDEKDAAIQVLREHLNQAAAQTIGVLRSVADLNEPSDLRLSGSGPASAVAMLATGGFTSGDGSGPTRNAALQARVSADIDVEGDPIEAAARAVGDGVFANTRSGSIAAIACAAALARLRTWVDPFSATPKSGYLVGGGTPKARNA